MASSTSSEFLTFYRRFATSSSLRQPLTARPLTNRPFSTSVLRQGVFKKDDTVKTDAYPDGEHATDKKDRLDVQSDNSAKGRE